jgi:5-methylcytosine-specific restriction endonuclease McrBC regulatory subunit McrC
VKELFASLHKFVASMPDKRLLAEEVQKPSTDLHILDPAVAFYKALSDTIDEGIPFIYERTTSTTSRPRGRVLFNETLRSLRTRGISHKVVCGFNVREFDVNLSDVVSTVASLLEAAHDVPPMIQLRISRLVDLFGGQVLTTQQATEKANLLLEVYSDRNELARLLRICRSVLVGEQNVWDMEIPIAGGECRFCNMDRLWELAVWTAFKEASNDQEGLTVELHPFARAGMRLLTEGGPRIDPDVVIFEDGEPAVIVDAKYSESGSAVAGDVYQIVCYTQRVKAAKGVLVYLSDKGSWSTNLGRTEDGRVISAVGINGKSNVALDFVAAARNTLNAEES